MFLSRADGDVRDLLELPQECQGSFQGLGGKVRFLLNHSRGKAPQLTLSGEFPGLSRVAAGLLSSDNGDLRDPLFELQGGPLSTGVARGPSGFLCSRCQGRNPHLEMRPETLGFSPGPIWISVFLWNFHRGVRPRLMWRHAYPLSSRSGKAVSGFLSG